MAKNLELLLLETVPNLGIIGDVVKVKAGFARNYLLPFAKAEAPTQEKIDALADQRQAEQARLEKLRSEQTALMEKLNGYELTIERATNDQGVLYGGIAQHEIAELLREAGFAVEDRWIRMGDQVKRVDTYHIPVWVDKDLKGEVIFTVNSDRELDFDDEVEIDDEGDLVHKSAGSDEAPAEEVAEEAAAEA